MPHGRWANYGIWPFGQATVNGDAEASRPQPRAARAVLPRGGGATPRAAAPPRASRRAAPAVAAACAAPAPRLPAPRRRRRRRRPGRAPAGAAPRSAAAARRWGRGRYARCYSARPLVGGVMLFTARRRNSGRGRRQGADGYRGAILEPWTTRLHGNGGIARVGFRATFHSSVARSKVSRPNDGRARSDRRKAGAKLSLSLFA
jgi:hypothetical protein